VHKELIERSSKDQQLPQFRRSALVQIHCHEYAVIKIGAEQNMLKRLGLDYEIMASGCCGMAGSFGFEAEKYDVSIAAAERAWLPKIRETSASSLILANGFSCREQIEQTTGRPTMHIAELTASELTAAI